MAVFARLFPKDVLDHELRQLVIESTSRLHSAILQLLLENAPVRTVNSRSGDVVLTKADVSLDVVENIAPADLPLSSATTAALNLKRDRAERVPIDEVQGLQAELDERVLMVNGNLPDESGNVAVGLPDTSQLAQWPAGAVIGDVVTLTPNGWEAVKPYPHDGPVGATVVGDPTMPYGWRWAVGATTPDILQVATVPQWEAGELFTLDRILTDYETQSYAAVAGTPGTVMATSVDPGEDVVDGGPGVFTAPEVTDAGTSLRIDTGVVVPEGVRPAVDTDVTQLLTSRAIQQREPGPLVNLGGTASGDALYSLWVAPDGELYVQIPKSQQVEGASVNLTSSGVLMRLQADWSLPVTRTQMWQVA